jgi:protein-disulfide isomerase
MNTVTLSRVVGVIGLLALSSAVGCKKAEKKDPNIAGEAKGDTKAGDTKTGDTKASDTKASGGPCEQLSKKVCDKAGDSSSTCTNAKATLSLLSDAACSQGIKDFSGTEAKLKEQGKKCDDLTQKLCAGVGPETETCKMVTEKTKAFPPEQCEQMLAHVGEIVDDLKKQESSNQPLSTEQMAALTAADAPSFGPKDSKVKIVEFSDFQCPYCSKAADVASQVKEKYGTKVHFVFRQFPLGFHQQAEGAAQAALAANDQGKFWEYHDHMFKNQSKLERADLEGYAKEVGLNLTKFKADLDANKYQERVKADMKMGSDVAVQGTPTMFINGKRVSNPTDFAAVSQEIETALGT